MIRRNGNGYAKSSKSKITVLKSSITRIWWTPICSLRRKPLIRPATGLTRGTYSLWTALKCPRGSAPGPGPTSIGRSFPLCSTRNSPIAKARLHHRILYRWPPPRHFQGGEPGGGVTPRRQIGWRSPVGVRLSRKGLPPASAPCCVNMPAYSFGRAYFYPNEQGPIATVWGPMFWGCGPVC